MCFSDLFIFNQNNKRKNIKIVELGFAVMPKRIPLLNKQNELIGFIFYQSIELFP